MNNTEKKPIRLSNLAIRFYQSDGWERAEIVDCLKSGTLITKDKDTNGEYYVLCPGSNFDAKKLRQKISVVIPAFQEQNTDIDKVLDEYNF